MDPHSFDPFQKKYKYNTLQIREQKILSLRKEKLNNITMLSRINSFKQTQNSTLVKSENEYQINIPDLHIDSNDTVKLFYSSNNVTQINLATKMLQSPDISLRKFGFRQIRNYASTLTKNDRTTLLSIITKEIFQQILNFLTPDQDKRIIYEISWICIYLTYLTNEYSITINQNAMQFYTLIRNQTDLIIKKQLLWIIGNVMSGGSYILKKTLEAHQYLPNYIYSMLEDTNIMNNIHIYGTIIWLYGLFFDSEELKSDLINIKCFIHIPIINKFTKTKINMYLFQESIYAIKQFLVTLVNVKDCCKDRPDYEKYNTLISNLSLYQLVNGIYEKENDNKDYIDCKTNILNIFVILSYIDDDYTVQLIDNDILEQIELILDLFESNKLLGGEFISYFLLFIYNMASSKSKEVLHKLRNSTICKRLINLLNNNILLEHKEVIISIFKELLESRSDRIKTELIVIGVPELCNNALDDIDDMKKEDIVLMSLENLKILLEYGDEFIKEKNIIQELLEHKNCRGKLEKILLSKTKNKNICNIAESVLNKYFGKKNNEIY